ncbi:MAG: acyltransferase [Rubrivivax sp.]|nr:acyltransferase [Rubrivivax sp.]
MDEKFRVNNFDLIRLLAALQVAFEHAVQHLQVAALPALREFAALFPGVPIFFFVSGFLISRSFERNPDLREYAQNRALRIYPALIVCTLVAVASVAFTGYFRSREFSAALFVAWIAGQVTFVQFFNPDFMRGFGTGVLNGSLWSVTVELQFYVLLPLVYAVARVDDRDPARGRSSLLALLALALLAQLGRDHVGSDLRATLPFKLLNVSFVPWIFLFLLGVLTQRHFEVVHARLAGRFLPWFVAYIVAAMLATRVLGMDIGNAMNPLLSVLLAAAVFAFAYTRPALGHRLLRGNDISYGVYIYHVPVINLFIHAGWVGLGLHAVVGVVGISLALAAASWWGVERPCLRLKRHPMNPVAVGRHV